MNKLLEINNAMVKIERVKDNVYPGGRDLLEQALETLYNVYKEIEKEQVGK